MIRCIVMDLDDTLLSSDLSISEANFSAIQRATQQGIKVILASGRMVQSMKPYSKKLGLDTPLIAYNGAIIADVNSDKILYNRPVPTELAVELVPLFREAGVHFNVYLHDELFMDEMTPWGKKYISTAGVIPQIVGDVVPFIQEPPHKMLGAGEIAEIDPLQIYLTAKFKGKLDFTRSKANYLEILAPGVSKGRAIQELITFWGIKQEEVLAIGDALNDLTMISWSGVGVAIGNAVEEVKEVAATVVADHNHNGVAEAIQQFVFES